MHASVNPHQSWWSTHGIYGGEGLILFKLKHTLIPTGWNSKEQKWVTKKARTGNGTNREIKWKIEALQASFKSTKWQRWVRQLRFSDGSLWYSSSPFSCLANLGLHLFMPCRFTPGQEVFGSSVVACLECYRESSSDGRPALPLFAVNPWK